MVQSRRTPKVPLTALLLSLSFACAGAHEDDVSLIQREIPKTIQQEVGKPLEMDRSSATTDRAEQVTAGTMETDDQNEVRGAFDTELKRAREWLQKKREAGRLNVIQGMSDVSQAQQNHKKKFAIQYAYNMAWTMAHMMEDPHCRADGRQHATVDQLMQLAMAFKYGNHCGQNYGASAGAAGTKGPCSAAEPTSNETAQMEWVHPGQNVLVEGKEETVCSDHGLDTCCAQHDTARVSYYADIIAGHPAWIGECAVNRRMYDCSAAVEESLNKDQTTDSNITAAAQNMRQASNFYDGAKYERDAISAPLCMFPHVPCVIATSFPNKWRLVWPYGDINHLDGHKCQGNCWTTNQSEWINITDTQVLYQSPFAAPPW